MANGAVGTFVGPCSTAAWRSRRHPAALHHVGLLAFGWGYYAWALPMITVYLTLLRNERRWRRTAPATLDRRLAGVAQW